jgi:hypothetical protein
MNPAINFDIAHADPNAAPLNINGFIDILKPLCSAVIQGSYIPYVLQNGTPNVDDQDKAWIELDSAGRPISIRVYYAGNWRRIYSGIIGEVRMYNGNPGDTTIWDADGHGVVGGIYDGWQICNGKNNSPDLQDSFIIAAHMKADGGHPNYKDGTWRTFVDGKSDLQFGGSKDHLIVQNDLPPFNPTGGTSGNGTNDVTIHGNEAKSGTDHGTDVKPIIDPFYGNLKTHDWTLGHYGANPDGGDPQVPIPTLPPFIAIGYIVFQGY